MLDRIAKSRDSRICVLVRLETTHRLTRKAKNDQRPNNLTVIKMVETVKAVVRKSQERKSLTANRIVFFFIPVVMANITFETV